MLLPSTGELLRGLRTSLAETVLPAMPKGTASQQLRAALHLIGRLERCWDLAATHFARDNADIEQFLGGVLPAEGPQSLTVRLGEHGAEQPRGFNDPALRAAATRNLALHAILAEQPDSQALHALHARMVARDSVYVGDHAPDDNEIAA